MLDEMTLESPRPPQQQPNRRRTFLLPPKIFGPAQNKRQVIRHDNPQQLSILLIVRFTGKGEPEQKRFRSEMVNRERERNKKEILNAIETGRTHKKRTTTNRIKGREMKTDPRGTKKS